MLLLLAACGDDTSDANDKSDSSDEGDESFDAGSEELDCTGVFDCTESCDDGDDDCVETCLANGSSEAFSSTYDLLECAESNGCSDEDCLASECADELLACAGLPVLDAGTRDAGGTHDAGVAADAGDAGSDAGDAGPSCLSAGKPEMTGPITGLKASYAAGDPIEIAVPVDADTARVIVGVYEVGSTLYLGGTAEDVAGSSSKTLNLFAGVKNGAVGTFYISVELCSTSICTTPFVRNTYQRANRTAAPLANGETYAQTRENVGGPALTESCGSTIPIQSFRIE